jgi:hypothetical protein
MFASGRLGTPSFLTIAQFQLLQAQLASQCLRFQSQFSAQAVLDVFVVLTLWRPSGLVSLRRLSRSNHPSPVVAQLILGSSARF